MTKSQKNYLYQAVKKHRSTCKKAESHFRRDMLNKLLTIEANNPKLFWKTLKDMKEWGRDDKDPSNCIPPEKWASYFKTLLNSPKDQKLDMLVHDTIFIPEMDGAITGKELSDTIN